LFRNVHVPRFDQVAFVHLAFEDLNLFFARRNATAFGSQSLRDVDVDIIGLC